jgi:bifunctional non-homologous end joining protein LigD
VGDDWIHEVKYDGYRILARIEDHAVTLLTRGAKNWTSQFPSVVRALEKLPVESALLDGELVALDQGGRSDFQALQNFMSGEHTHRLVYYAFDLLFDSGESLVSLPLLDRKARLARILGGSSSSGRRPQATAPPAGNQSTVRYSDHVIGNGQAFFERACAIGLEGIVSKLARSSYRAGRGHEWLKIKCSLRQEFVIVGYSDPAGNRTHLGALLLGARRDGELRYTGRVGTGFTERSLRDLKQRLLPLAQRMPTVSNAPVGARSRGVHWVKPQLVAEVSFTGFTKDGLLRHPSFQGLREDKPAAEVTVERVE